MKITSVLVIIIIAICGYAAYATSKQPSQLKEQVEAYNQITGLKTTDNPSVFNEKLERIKKFR